MIILIKTQIRKKFLVPWEKLLRSSLGLNLMNMQPGGRKTLKKKKKVSKAYLKPVFWNVKHLVTNGDHSWCSYLGTAADAVLEMSCAHWKQWQSPHWFQRPWTQAVGGGLWPVWQGSGVMDGKLLLNNTRLCDLPTNQGETVQTGTWSLFSKVSLIVLVIISVNVAIELYLIGLRLMFRYL